MPLLRRGELLSRFLFVPVAVDLPDVVSLFAAHFDCDVAPMRRLFLAQEEDREPLQYLNAFVRMYGADAVEAASAALSGEAPFYGLQAADGSLMAFPAHQALLAAYEKLQRAKRAFWSN